MLKPGALRKLLLTNLPALADDPSRLDTFVDKGRIGARRSNSLAFEYRYTLTVVLLGFAGDRDLLMVLFLAWIADNQPDLLDRAPGEPFSFEAELLDNDAADVEITLELTERVLVAPKPGGGVITTHLPDAPRPDAFGEGEPPGFAQLTLGGDDATPAG